MIVAPLDLFALNHHSSEEDRAIAAVVKDYVDANIRPHVADWFENGDIPARELARDFGSLGVLGMHLEGYGCAGTSATAYGLAALELEAGDSGIRSLVSVQGSLAMYAIHEFGTEEQNRRGCQAWQRVRLLGVLDSPKLILVQIPAACSPTPSVMVRTGFSTDPKCGSPTEVLLMYPLCGPKPMTDPRFYCPHKLTRVCCKHDSQKDVTSRFGNQRVGVHRRSAASRCITSRS